MHFLATTNLVLLPFAAASPFLPRQARNATTQLTFTGAGASFSVTAPVDGTTFQLGESNEAPDRERERGPRIERAGREHQLTLGCPFAPFLTGSAISVDHIAQAGSASCTFSGVDKAQLTVLGANTGATLAPPQTITAGQCVAI